MLMWYLEHEYISKSLSVSLYNAKYDTHLKCISYFLYVQSSSDFFFPIPLLKREIHFLIILDSNVQWVFKICYVMSNYGKRSTSSYQ